MTGRINDTLVSNVLRESIETISGELFDRLPLKQTNDLSKMSILPGQTGILYFEVMLIPQSLKNKCTAKTNKKVARSKFKIEQQM